MRKALQKEGLEGTCHNIIKATYDRPTANVRNKTWVATLTTLIQLSVDFWSHTDLGLDLISVIY